jgi:hypothetical protein
MSKNNVWVSIEVITPAIAKAYLTKNGRNRKMRGPGIGKIQREHHRATRPGSTDWMERAMLVETTMVEERAKKGLSRFSRNDAYRRCSPPKMISENPDYDQDPLPKDQIA